MSTLVSKLSAGQHRIVLARAKTAKDLREAIQVKFILLTFPDTAGGTELGLPLDTAQTRVDGADFEAGVGQVHLVGRLTIDFVEVTIRAAIELQGLTGFGSLELSTPTLRQ